MAQGLKTADIVPVLGLDFKVVDAVGAGLAFDAGDASRAGPRPYVLTDFQPAGPDPVLPVFRPERATNRRL